MKIVFEDEEKFTSDKASSFNWTEYGCKFHIQKGSIKTGEHGSVHIYGIHAGPFDVPDEITLASAIYYISLSHDLLKTATLEIQHCSKRCYDENGECCLTFMSALDTASGPPYRFQPIPGGHFGDAQYGFIQRKSFSGFVIGFINRLKSLFWYPFSENPPEKRRKLTSSKRVEGDEGSPLNYGALYFLKAIDNPRTWGAKILLTEYLNSNQRVRNIIMALLLFD